MFNWDKVENMEINGDWFVFTDDQGKQARLDKEAVIICVSGYKSQNG